MEDGTVQSRPTPRSALDECNALMSGYGREARKMQVLGWVASLSIILSSTLIPVSIVVSTETGDFFFGKLLPALLAALAAIAAGAAQIVRPYDRWRLFNKQRYLLEAERLAYLHRVGDYASEDPDAVLIAPVIATTKAVTDAWEREIVPASTAQAIEELRQGTPLTP